MVRHEVVAYLQANLKQHPAEELRRQLAEEGVSDEDFEDSLKAALREPRRTGVLWLAAGVAVVAALAALLTMRREPIPPPPPPAAAKAVSATGESAFVGNTGYVVGLPKNYEAVAVFKDEKKTIEIVHFCRTGTDPTNFMQEGLFGQLGIVRLEVQPNPWAGDILGPEHLARAVSAERAARGDKFSMKNLQVGSLRGVQVQTDLPEPCVEAYILGETVMYHFYAGQEGEVYRDLVNSLRDPHAEAL
jgi:hypothetical protein